MGKLEELKSKLKELSPEEVAELKTFLDAESVKEPEAGEEAKSENEVTDNAEPIAEESIQEEAKEDVKTEVPTEPVTEDATPTEEPTVETPAGTEGESNTEPEVKAEAPVEPVEGQENAQIPVNEDDIPPMQKGIDAIEENTEPVSQPITDENGKDLPVDYEQVIDGLNAKITALEAENAGLKSKVESAFGYSSKPAIPTKVNRLYDECDDVHIHR